MSTGGASRVATTTAIETSRGDSPPRISLNSAPTRSISEGGKGTRTAPRKFIRFGENGVHGSGEPMPSSSRSSARSSLNKPFARDSLPRRASTALTSCRRSARRVPASRQTWNLSFRTVRGRAARRRHARNIERFVYISCAKPLRTGIRARSVASLAS